MDRFREETKGMTVEERNLYIKQEYGEGTIGIPAPVTAFGKELKKGEKIVLDGGGGTPTTLLLMSEMRKEGRFDDLN